MTHTAYTIVVLGDSHVEPNQCLNRFSALGRYLLHKKPTHIISIGDFLSLDSLSAWDQDKKRTMEGVRYWNDISAGNKALDLMTDPIMRYNKERKRLHKSQYKPVKIYLKGNHEHRLDRYLDKNPVLDGSEISLEHNLKLSTREWRVVPYKEHYVLNGIAFTHVPISNNGFPVGGKYICQRALDLYNYSIVFGHTHRLEVANKHRHGGEHLQQSLNCGCFFEHTPEYVRGAATDYWRGLTVLQVNQNMRFDMQTISMSELLRRFK